MSDEIIPDDKNWTWVLERRCDDCGFDAASFVASTVGQAVRDQAVRWTAVLARHDVRVRTAPGVWSPLEYSCHVRDVFRKFDGRLEMMLERDDPHFENWDPDATAVEDRYDLQDPGTVATELAAAAEAFARRFDSVAGAQWERRGYRSDGAEFTVETLAKYLIHDPVHHLWDVGAAIDAARWIGRPAPEAPQLHEFPVHLAASGAAEGLERFADPPAWYAAYEQRYAGDGAAGRLVTWHSFDCSWDSWEMHPRGDEVVVCVEGVIDLVQEVGGEEVTTSLGPGQWAINTAGTWHTADVPAGVTASCLFITSGLGTRHRAR